MKQLDIIITDDKKEKENSFEAKTSLEITTSKGQVRMEMFTFVSKDEYEAYICALELIALFKKSLEEKTCERNHDK